MDDNKTIDEKAKTEEAKLKMLNEIDSTPDIAEEIVEARLAVGGILNNANIARILHGKSMSRDLDMGGVFEAMLKRADRVNNGNLKDAEVMLMSQATALDSIFSHLTFRSIKNMGDYLGATEKYMKLALRAQGQCRATLETLAMMKNPQPYVR